MSDRDIGGKARRLTELVSLGAPVPPFAVLPVDLDPRDQGLLASWLSSTGLSLPVAVRSSADVEDGMDRSYAGMFTSRLAVSEIGELAAAIEEVRQSGVSERLAAYQHEAGRALAPRVQVIVQNMVEARTAGVALVRAVEAEDAVRVEAVSGLGEVLVSGQRGAEPDVFVFGLQTYDMRSRRRGAQAVRMRADGARELVPMVHRLRWNLSDAEALEVARMAGGLDRKFAFPYGTDVEWAYNPQAQLFVLQVRPLARASAA